MSKGPAWLATAEKNVSGNEVGQAAMIDGKILRGKPGRKKSPVNRKVIGLNFSEDQNRKLTELEMTLKFAGLDLVRGRSEAAELAINLALAIMNGKSSDDIKSWSHGFLFSMTGIEDKQAVDDQA